MPHRSNATQMRVSKTRERSIPTQSERRYVLLRVLPQTPCTTGRVGQNHTIINIYGVHTVFSREITIHTVCIYGSGQP